MKNLEQIRAKNALEAVGKYEFKGKNEGDIVKKIPTMILDNGILATATFAKEARHGYEKVFHAVIDHLKNIGTMPNDQNQIISWLVTVDSSELRAVTAETMAYLNYLRRFAK